MTYLVDTNIFIEAKNRYYGFDIVPSFWEFLDHNFESGRLMSIKPVSDELRRGEDDLASWAEHRPQFFHSLDNSQLVEKLGEIAQWVNSQRFTQGAVAEFLSVADYFIVAYAAAYNLTVVTLEQFSPEAKKRVLIPVVCQAFNVPYVDTFEMMRQLRAQI